MPENQNPTPPLQLAAGSTLAATTITMMNGVDVAAVEGDEDRFDRLPDALIVVIFNKVFDVKSLFRCFSVSKRFASLVPQTDTIFMPVPVPPRRVLAKLHKFTTLRSLVIELYPSKDYSSLWVRHKSVIGARLEIFVAIFASALHKNHPRTIDDSALVMDLEEKNIRGCLDGALVKHRLAQRLIRTLPALCELVISDRIIDGKMCMGEEQIVELRNYGAQLSPSEVIGGARGVRVQKWHAPVLELPLCGCVMEKATVVVVRREDDEEIVMQRDLGFILGAFGYEDHDGKIVDEVVNVVRQKMVIDDNDGAASINTHQLKFVEDHEVFCIKTLRLHH